MTHKFEEYPELAEMMQEYAAFGKFGDWQKFTDALNNALIKAEKLPIHNVVGRSEQLRAFKKFLQSEYHLTVSNKMVDEFEQKQSS